MIVLLVMPLAAQNPLTLAEQRGRQIYEQGTSASGVTPEALLDGDSRVPASVLPCANCHGPDGLGKAEGGVTPSNITWDALTKPYVVTQPDGRSRPAYVERLLTRAIAMGLDPAGNALGGAMPRYRLSLADASDLAAYIRRLGNAVDPGLTATAIRLGVVLPPDWPTANTSGIARQALLDYFAHVNADGGIFNRRVELVFLELPPNAPRRPDAVRDFLNKAQVFAILGDFTGAESGIAGVMRDTRTPAFPALHPFPETASPVNPYVFYLDGGLKEELEALVNFAAERFPGKDERTEIISSGEGAVREYAAWLRALLLKSGRQNIFTREDVEVPQAEVVFWLRQEHPVMPAITKADRTTALFVPGSIAGELAALHPTRSLRMFIALRAPAAGPPGFNTSTRLTWERVTASAAVVTEAMKQAGRDLSRRSLLSVLERFHSVQTNLPYAITFGPGRRIGGSGIRILALEFPGGQTSPTPHSSKY